MQNELALVCRLMRHYSNEHNPAVQREIANRGLLRYCADLQSEIAEDVLGVECDLDDGFAIMAFLETLWQSDGPDTITSLLPGSAELVAGLAEKTPLALAEVLTHDMYRLLVHIVL